MKAYSLNGNVMKDRVIAKGMVRRVRYSTKKLVAICDAIRYMPINKALDLLDKIEKKEMPVRVNWKRRAHRSELGGKPGIYPEKGAKIIKKLLQSVIKNAEYKGFNTENLKVLHCSANKEMIIYRGFFKGGKRRRIVSSGGRGTVGSIRRIRLNKVEIGVGEW